MMRTPRGYRDRAEAGRTLAAALSQRAASPGAHGTDSAATIVLGLARGGVPVAAEVARTLSTPLDVIVVRKLGVPSQPEFGFGAIAENDALVVDETTVALIGMSPETLESVRERESVELARRARVYRGDRPLADIRDKNVVLVDDGLATGVTMRAAVALVRKRGAAHITVAVPVGARESIAALPTEADVVCPTLPRNLGAVGYWYDDFRSPTDDEIRALLS